MRGSYLGPKFSDDEVTKFLNSQAIPHQQISRNELNERVADLLNDGAVVGWFQGRMEFGPRALGNRTILGDARHPDMQKKMNLTGLTVNSLVDVPARETPAAPAP